MKLTDLDRVTRIYKDLSESRKEIQNLVAEIELRQEQIKQKQGTVAKILAELQLLGVDNETD